MKKKMLSLSLALMLCGAQVFTVSADREQDLLIAQSYTNAALNEAYNTINALEAEKAAIRETINFLDENLIAIMVSVAVLEGNIAEKEADIAKTESDLGKAEKAKEKQYESMKKRIQVLYEKGGDTAWFQMLLNTDDVSELLTRAEYTQELYDHDREALQKYADVVEQVELLNKQYNTEKAELQAMHDEFTLQQEALETQIAELEATSAVYDDQIAYAQGQVSLYAAILEQQTQELYMVQIEKWQAQQAYEQALAQAAYEQALAEQEAQQSPELVMGDPTADAAGMDDLTMDAMGMDDTGMDDMLMDGMDMDLGDLSMDDLDLDGAAGDVSYDSHGNVIVDPSSVTTTAPATNTSSQSSGGNSVVDFATQYVGNPYVWGGTSLTDGADCSGFVQSVYSNFGVSLPRTSYDQMTVGQEVSYENAQPGDLICYGGHIAIYMGNGQIVHAANEDQGIIISDNAAYDTILSVRRVI